MSFAKTRLSFAKTGLSFGKTVVSFAKTHMSFGKIGLSFKKRQMGFTKTQMGFSKTGMTFGKTRYGFGGILGLLGHNGGFFWRRKERFGKRNLNFWGLIMGFGIRKHGLANKGLHYRSQAVELPNCGERARDSRGLVAAFGGLFGGWQGSYGTPA